MACAGLGSHTRADDADSDHQYHRALLYTQEVLEDRMSSHITMPRPSMPEPTVAAQPDAQASKSPAPAKISVQGMNFFYGRTQALSNISLEVSERLVVAFIGPSGCGKSTFLRTLN